MVIDILLSPIFNILPIFENLMNQIMIIIRSILSMDLVTLLNTISSIPLGILQQFETIITLKDMPPLNWPTDGSTYELIGGFQLTFDQYWQTFAIVSLIIDIFMLLFNAIAALLSGPETLGIGAAGFGILAILSLIPLVLDFSSHDYFWGDIFESLGVECDPSSDEWYELLSFAVVFPIVSLICGWLASRGLIALTGGSAEILTIIDIANGLFGLWFFLDEKGAF